MAVYDASLCGGYRLDPTSLQKSEVVGVEEVDEPRRIDITSELEGGTQCGARLYDYGGILVFFCKGLTTKNLQKLGNFLKYQCDVCNLFGDCRLLSSGGDIVCERCRLDEFYQINIQETLPTLKGIEDFGSLTTPPKLPKIFTIEKRDASLLESRLKDMKDCSMSFGSANAIIFAQEVEVVEVDEKCEETVPEESEVYVIKNDTYAYTIGSETSSVLEFYKKYNVLQKNTPCPRLPPGSAAWDMIKTINSKLGYDTVEPLRHFKLFDRFGILKDISVDSRVSESMFLSAYLANEKLEGTNRGCLFSWDEYMIYKAMCKSLYGGDATLSAEDVRLATCGTQTVPEQVEVFTHKQIGNSVRFYPFKDGDTECKVKIAKRWGTQTALTFFGGSLTTSVTCDRRTLGGSQATSAAGGTFLFRTHAYDEEHCVKYDENMEVSLKLNNNRERSNIVALVRYFIKT